jgi:hypothetical protein
MLAAPAAVAYEREDAMPLRYVAAWRVSMAEVLPGLMSRRRERARRVLTA